jgi:hypothetical protein
MSDYGQPYPETPDNRMVQRARERQSEVMSFRDTCLACGEPMGPALTFAASLRCHHCRTSHAPLRVDLVEHARLSAVPPEPDRLAA